MRMPGFRSLPLLALLAAAAPSSAQVQTDERLWTSINVQERSGTASAWRWAIDGFMRTRDGVGTMDSMAARFLIGFDITPQSSVWGGYSAGPSFPASGGTIIEQRLAQQFLWSGRAAGWALSLRSRMEQRFIEGNSGTQVRVRQQIRFSRPIAPGSRLAIVGSEEIFFHVNETSRFDRGLDQNRAFAGLSRVLNGHVRVEAGYLNQYSHSRTGPNRMNHILSAGGSLTF
jgi:hypothetical protein